MADDMSAGERNELRRVIEDLATIHAHELLTKHGLNDWRIAWHDRGDLAGRCSFGARTITLNRRVLLDTAARNVVETVLHEIAHALVADDGHGRRWHDKLLEIGGTGVWVFNDGRVACQPPTGTADVRRQALGSVAAAFDHVTPPVVSVESVQRLLRRLAGEAAP